MLTSWSIENFKSFKNRTSLELAPLTVLAGPNNAGKSTILRSMLLAKQSIEASNDGPVIVLNGPQVSLGTVEEIAPQGTTAEPTRISFECDWKTAVRQFSCSFEFGAGFPSREGKPLVGSAEVSVTHPQEEVQLRFDLADQDPTTRRKSLGDPLELRKDEKMEGYAEMEESLLFSRPVRSPPGSAGEAARV